MNASNTALVLIGFQKDYFDSNGILRSVIEESAKTTRVLENTIELINQLKNTDTLILETPILFSEDYSETQKPVGLLKAIAELKAFQKGSDGAKTIDPILQFGDRIQTVPGKDGFNAFSKTGLEAALVENGIENVVFAGAVTSICIDSTGRSAHERGYRVSILSDCTCGRTDFEQNFYCEQILPLYANVCTSKEFLGDLL